MLYYPGMKQRIIFIGDIHGHLDEFLNLLDKLQFSKENDRLILLGDLVDRGPKSAEVVTKAMEMGIECIRGNHDQRYLDIEAKVNWHKKNPNNTIPSVLRNKEKMEVFKSLSAEASGGLKACQFLSEFQNSKLLQFMQELNLDCCRRTATKTQ